MNRREPLGQSFRFRTAGTLVDSSHGLTTRRAILDVSVGAHGHRLMPRAAGRLSGFIEPCQPSEGPTAQTPAPPS